MIQMIEPRFNRQFNKHVLAMYTEQSSSLLSSLDFSHVKDYRHIKSSLNRHVSYYDLLLPPGTSRY
jgi:hypothetical protein